ncbi:hypothetical protein P3L10_028360 [Capsicum annuum]
MKNVKNNMRKNHTVDLLMMLSTSVSHATSYKQEKDFRSLGDKSASLTISSKETSGLPTVAARENKDSLTKNVGKRLGKEIQAIAIVVSSLTLNLKSYINVLIRYAHPVIW